MFAFAAALALAAAAPSRPPPAKPAPTPGAAELPTVAATYLHDLSTANGLVALTWPALAYDRAHSELFMVAEGFVRIFDASGMEVHRFGDDGALGYIMRVAPLEDGELILISSLNGVRTYLRCDFRGEPLGSLTLTGLPAEFANFEPDQLVYADSRLYFAERGSMRVVVTDVMGGYRFSYKLRDLVAAKIAGDKVAGDSDRKPAVNMDAFNVDAAGNLLFTMSTMFAGGIVSPSGDLRLFGTRGSMPGKFNIIGGIDADEKGYVFVTDRLRSVVSVWDRELRYLGEFGYRGSADGNLWTPYEIVVGNGRVFVSQARNLGVRVFQVRIVEPKVPDEPPPLSAPPEPPPSRGPRRGESLG